jgi:hypothetical protein
LPEIAHGFAFVGRKKPDIGSNHGNEETRDADLARRSVESPGLPVLVAAFLVATKPTVAP